MLPSGWRSTLRGGSATAALCGALFGAHGSEDFPLDRIACTSRSPAWGTLGKRLSLFPARRNRPHALLSITDWEMGEAVMENADFDRDPV